MLLAPNPDQTDGDTSSATGGSWLRERDVEIGEETFTLDYSDLAFTTAPSIVTVTGVRKVSADDTNVEALCVGTPGLTTQTVTLASGPATVACTIAYLVKL